MKEKEKKNVEYLKVKVRMRDRPNFSLPRAVQNLVINNPAMTFKLRNIHRGACHAFV